jgi:hypothetical protein
LVFWPANLQKFHQIINISNNRTFASLKNNPDGQAEKEGRADPA